MITKNKSSKWQLARYLLVVPVIVGMTMSFSVYTDEFSPNISPIKIEDYNHISSSSKSKTYIDFVAKEGTPVMVTADGVVANIDFQKNSYGKLVTINHGNGYETMYAHLSDYAVKVGAKVKQGDIIAFVGRSGKTTRSHLHYEVLKEGKNMNPLLYGYWLKVSNSEARFKLNQEEDYAVAVIKAEASTPMSEISKVKTFLRNTGIYKISFQSE